MLESTMQDTPLSIRSIFEYGRRIFAESQVVTFEGDHSRRASFAEVGARAEKLAAALDRLGVKPGDRVATFQWNNQEHLEAYFAVPCMGAVLHTLNIRLFPEQLSYVINHAEDDVILIDGSLVPLLAKVVDELKKRPTFILVGEGDASALGEVLHYEELLAAESEGYSWPEIDERQAAAMCYTSGTTGNPKGVVYSHRSSVLHAMAATSVATFGLSQEDRALMIVPMFHANAWGLPHATWQAGADIILPEKFLQAEPLCRLIAEEKPTFSGAVPTVWNDILRYAEGKEVDLSSLRMVVCGGSAVPRSLMEALDEKYGVRMIQAWGMTETSPLAAVAHPPRGHDPADDMDWRTRTGRVSAGVELRIVDDEGRELPWDGESVGEIQVRGPWITASYYKDPSDDKFQDGWLRTGDVAHVDSLGFIQITDRAKDVIKSGGEWISSVELENEIMAHPDVVEAAVVGVPDDRWDERPMACVVLADGAKVGAEELTKFLASRVAKWWLPERWAFIDEVPKTSVGKFDKKVLRAQHAKGELLIVG
ncbi:MAG TPA: fatty-acid--CoA ligase [Myxococcales bacterium]|nr:fatty-acid--CoA ligase [Myxococcales bacterium]HIL02406.1 fatty-acid--CoA ligase [Myxococcales bacterium]